LRLVTGQGKRRNKGHMRWRDIIRRNALKPRGDIDAVAHQVAVAFLDDVADMDPDAKLDASLRGRSIRPV
jgi:hypothetical protein